MFKHMDRVRLEVVKRLGSEFRCLTYIYTNVLQHRIMIGVLKQNTASEALV